MFCTLSNVISVVVSLNQLIYEKLPKDISERHVLLLDPVLATGQYYLSLRSKMSMKICQGSHTSFLIYIFPVGSSPYGSICLTQGHSLEFVRLIVGLVQTRFEPYTSCQLRKALSLCCSWHLSLHLVSLGPDGIPRALAFLTLIPSMNYGNRGQFLLVYLLKRCIVQCVPCFLISLL